MKIYTRLLSTITVKLNIHKTEILFLPGCLSFTTYPTLTYKCYTLLSQSVIKYLGVMLDNRFIFTPTSNIYTKIPKFEKSKKIMKQLQVLFQHKIEYANRTRRIMLEGTIATLWKYTSTVFSHTLPHKSANRAITRKRRSQTPAKTTTTTKHPK